MPSYNDPIHTKMGTPVYKLPDIPARQPRVSARDALAAKMRAKYSMAPTRRPSRPAGFLEPMPNETVGEWRNRCKQA